MNSGRTNTLTDFEEREKKIKDFEEDFKQKEKQLKELTQKLKGFEEKSSQDEVVTSQIEQYEQKIKELDEMTSRLRNALGNLQEENIKLEDELNSIKSEHGDISELKSKLKVLDETVITQQKEIVEKDKILKGRATEEGGGLPEGTLQKIIVGKVETIKEFNRLLEDVKFRLFLIIPTVEDLDQLNLPKDSKVDTRVATAFDLSNAAHKGLISTYPHIEFRSYSKKDRWGIERDAEEICLVAESENKDYIGISSSDSKICELFLKLLTEAWLTATKITL
ncbi:MAG: hypothetical protein HWN66_05000 [Candidatus Helarchaeota archaeon]|nr:hypothetical protein [Candidatus Helarchaeota archaeon]